MAAILLKNIEGAISQRRRQFSNFQNNKNANASPPYKPVERFARATPVFVNPRKSARRGKAKETRVL